PQAISSSTVVSSCTNRYVPRPASRDSRVNGRMWYRRLSVGAAGVDGALTGRPVPVAAAWPGRAGPGRSNAPVRPPGADDRPAGGARSTRPPVDPWDTPAAGYAGWAHRRCRTVRSGRRGRRPDPATLPAATRSPPRSPAPDRAGPARRPPAG